MGRALSWAAWCFVLFWAWLFYNGQWTHTELIAAGCAGVIGTATAVVVQRCAFHKLRFRPQHLKRIWLPLWQIFPEFAWIAAAALRQLFHRGTGAFVAEPTVGPTGTDDPTGRAERVFLLYAGTLSPNDYVVDVDRETKQALRHVLLRREGEGLP
jgi:hypothetical protein